MRVVCKFLFKMISYFYLYLVVKVGYMIIFEIDRIGVFSRF